MRVGLWVGGVRERWMGVGGERGGVVLTLEMALERVGFGPVFLAPKRRFMLRKPSLYSR
jgi:hypothetical protein